MVQVYTEFCCRSGGSNLNAGTRKGDLTEPGTSANFTYASGNWVQSTGVFTVASGNPLSDGVAVGDYASVYADGSTTTGFVGRITARDSTTITVSGTSKMGTKPTDGTGTRTLKVGGAWLGPNGSDIWPFGAMHYDANDGTHHAVRYNFKNDASYSISASCADGANVVRQGYTTNYGDGGRATFDAGGNAIVPLALTGGMVVDLIVTNNGASGTNAGITLNSNALLAMRCVAHAIRGHGIQAAGTNSSIDTCEAYDCNKANAASTAGIALTGSGATATNCISHDNAGGSNAHGFHMGSTAGAINNCISFNNSGSGFKSSANNIRMENSDAWGNTGDGLNLSFSGCMGFVRNCNFLKNGGYGVASGGGYAIYVKLENCGFGSGTQANTSGAVDASEGVEQVGSITYGSGLTPWSDPTNGNFSITSASAKNAGLGTFTFTDTSYSGRANTVAYPDVGAVQHQDTGGGGGLLAHPGMRGGFA